MNTASPLFSLAAPFLFALASQNPPPGDRAPSEPPVFGDPAVPSFIAPASAAELSRLVFDEPGDGTIWVRGRTFKAKFDCKGFEYIPFLGSDAPRDYPIDFTIESARVGPTELPWQSGVQPELDGETVTFHRGAFDETYVVGTDSIEQNFVMRERTTSGDLRVIVHTDTELERADSSLGTAFANALGGVHVGKASIRDAHGRRVSSLTHLAGESIEILVPRNQLESASFPLAIDPLITTWTVTLPAAPTSNFPDTSYDWWTDTWLCVNQETFSSTDHDIMARQFTSAGTMVNQIYMEVGAADWTRPRVANENAQHRFMVVAELDASTSTGSIQARTYTATTHGVGSPFAVSPSNPGHKYFCPDVGGDDNPNGTPPFCVAYLESPNERDRYPTTSFAVNVTLVSPSGQLLSHSAFADADAEPARVSKSNGHYSSGGQEWTVVYPSGSSSQMWAQYRQVDSSGPVGFAFDTNSTIGTGYNALSVTPLLNGPGSLRAFAIATAKGAAGAVVEVEWFDIISGDPVNTELGSTGSSPASGVSVESDRTDIYMISAQPISSPHGPAQNNLYLTTFRPNPTDQVLWNMAALQFRVLIAGSTDDESMPSLASMHSSGGGSSNMLCVYKRITTVGGGAAILAATLY